MSAHTAGPWEVEMDLVEEGDISVVAAGMVPICAADCRDHPDDDLSLPRETALANARLIAAAPDLLMAARALAEHLMDMHTCRPDGEDDCRACLAFEGSGVVAAFAKAEGR